MIYSLTGLNNNNLKTYKEKDKLAIAIEIDGSYKGHLFFDNEQLNDLIGALHIIKSKIEKEGKDAK